MSLNDSTTVDGYRKLKAWQEAHALVLLVYKTTEKFPSEELFGLTSQLRRAATSVVANIVEGYARNTTKEFIQFLSISLGSLSEVEYYLFLANELHYLSNNAFHAAELQRTQTGKLLYGLRESMKRKSTR